MRTSRLHVLANTRAYNDVFARMASGSSPPAFLLRFRICLWRWGRRQPHPEARPGAFIFCGNGDSAGLHHPAYNFNDDAIVFGSSYWVQLVETTLAA